MNNKIIIDEFLSLRDRIIEQRYSHLDDAQIEAVLSGNNNYIIAACPGAGKTQVIINRVDYLTRFGTVYKSHDHIPSQLNGQDIMLMKEYINNTIISKENINRVEKLMGYYAVNPKNIIIITFTRAAAVNMKKRFEGLQGESKGNVIAPFFGTFHGLFYKILSRHYGKINIISTFEAYRVISAVLMKYLDEISDDKTNETLNDISTFKSKSIPIEEFNSNLDNNIFKECYEAYENYKKEKKLMDFDDLQLKCKELFTEKRNILEGYRKLFQYILVDEFQDCDSLQLDLLKMLNEYNYIYAVGDEDQCIYGFRGSRPDCMVNFSEVFSKGKILYLGINYRSVPNIVDTSKQLIKYNRIRNLKNIRAFKKQDGLITTLNNINENLQAEEVAVNIMKLVQLAGIEYKDIAVLYRTNVESRSIIDAFIRKDIPFKLLDKEYNFFEHFICKDLLAYLRLSIDCTDMGSFGRIINKPFRYISKINIEKIKSSRVKEDCFEKLKGLQEIPVFQVKNIDNLKRDIQQLNRMSLEGAINCILHSIGYYDYLKEHCIKYKTDISEIEEIVDEFKDACSNYKSIITFLAHVEEVKERIKNNKSIPDENRVILSTIHGVKGMEFKNVFIINCSEGNIPHKNSIDNNLEEERRLFYVAMTRAIDNLWFCYSGEVRGKAAEPSRFLKESGLFSNQKISSSLKRGDIIHHTAFGVGEISYIDEKIIEIEFRDKMKRKFDATIVQNYRLITKCD
ncbi:MAG: ATP-dependent helicase [Bacillota bacterium]|nr:ATP-dependent helicase [Bacillota bacterium]